MQIYLKDRCTAYHYLLSQRKGTKEAFMSALGEGYFTDFRNVGYIKEDVNGKWEERWQLTDFGEQQAQAYLDLAGLIGMYSQGIKE